MAKVLYGRVTSDKNDKTIAVIVETAKVHPIYKKRFVSTKKYQVHDPKNEAKVGDRVSIIEVRPISAKKKFALDKVIEKATIQFKEEETEV